MKPKIIGVGDMILSEDWVDIVYHVVGDTVHILSTRTDEWADAGRSGLHVHSLQLLEEFLERNSKVLHFKCQQ